MMTLRLREDGSVIPVVLPEPTRALPDGVAPTSAHRVRGLVLRSVSFPLPHLGRPVRTRLKDGSRAA